MFVTIGCIMPKGAVRGLPLFLGYEFRKTLKYFLIQSKESIRI